MSTYDDVVAATKNYYGFAAELFAGRVLNAIGKTKDDFAKSDVPAFASKISAAAGTSLTPEKAESFKKDVLKLA